MKGKGKRSQKTLHFDKDLCSGCLSCVVFCSQRRSGTSGPSRAGIRIIIDDFEGENSALFCLQCGRAPCAEACPGDVIRQVDGGWWEIDYDRCDGCALCVEACPLECMYVDPTDGQPIKCDLCGGEPICITVCPTGALSYESTKERTAWRRTFSEGAERRSGGRACGWTGRLLLVDLSSGKVLEEDSLSYANRLIGGRGLAAGLAWDRIFR